MNHPAYLKPPADGFETRYPPTRFEAILVVSFGGPEGMDDVIPFLENVTRGRGVPRERLEEVAHHYALFGGVSPINAQNRALIDALRPELDAHGIGLPVYFGNRNWHPYLADTLDAMADDGVERALAFFTSAYSSYSGCRQYREDLYAAQEQVGERAPEVLKLRTFFNHPGFVEANADHVRTALGRVPAERRATTQVVYTAHSIPEAMARACRYEQQLAETARLVSEAVGVSDTALVWQSRSGPPSVPWLEPDVNDHLASAAVRGVTDVVLAPIGFVSDHLEILFDLDVEAVETAALLGLGLERAATASTHPAFVAMIRELVQERLDPSVERRGLGAFAPGHDVCPVDCCKPGNGRPSPWEA
jgi:protoporphyrin/coproporphyrin ferrochelatase